MGQKEEWLAQPEMGRKLKEAFNFASCVRTEVSPSPVQSKRPWGVQWTWPSLTSPFHLPCGILLWLHFPNRTFWLPTFSHYPLVPKSDNWGNVRAGRELWGHLLQCFWSRKSPQPWSVLKMLIPWPSPDLLNQGVWGWEAWDMHY